RVTSICEHAAAESKSSGRRQLFGNSREWPRPDFGLSRVFLLEGVALQGMEPKLARREPARFSRSTKMEQAVIDRLRASKLQDDAELRAEGYSDGHGWAMGSAEAKE